MTTEQSPPQATTTTTPTSSPVPEQGPITAPAADARAAVEFLLRIRPSGYWLLASIDPEAASGDPAKIRACTFAAREAAEATAWIEAENRDRNLYWTVNSISRPLAKKPSREDIATMDMLHVDLDYEKRRPIDEERARIDALLADRWPSAVPRPSIVVDSGGGRQAFWLLEQPVEIGGREEAFEDAKRYNQQLELLLGGDSCHNVDRIMRLPGTVNWPDARKRAAGRTVRLAQVVGGSWAKHPLSAFLAAPQRQDSGTASSCAPRPSVQTSNVSRLLSVDELPEAVPAAVRVVIVQGRDPDNPNRWPSRSEPLFWACCELVRAGVPDDTIYAVITDPDFLISESVVEKGPRAERYALQQIAHAHEHCTHPQLAELNRRHAVIGDLGGRCRVIAEGHDPILDRDYFSVQTFEDLANRYSNRSVEIAGPDGPRQIELGRWWLRHPQRRQFDRMVFAPGQETPGAYNLWRGFACEARPGDCGLYLEHLRENICRGDLAAYEYVLSWMARAVQQPGKQAHTAIVLRGERGVGKGVFATGFGSLFGRHFFPITNPSQVFGQFNEHLLDTVVLFADEAFFAGDKRNEAVLKGLVTEETRTTEAKYRAAESVPNCLHLIMAANEDWVVPAGRHERRFLVLEVAGGRRQDSSYFGAISRQMAEGGREALLHLLSTRDVSEFNPRALPSTGGLREQKEHSFAPEEAWWFQKLSAGAISDGLGWPSFVACSEILHDFSNHMDAWGGRHRPSAVRVGKLLARAGLEKRQLGRRLMTIDQRGRPIEVDRPRVYLLPELPAARRTWNELFGEEFDWTEPETLADRPAEEPYA